MSGAKIIKALQEAAAGGFGRVTISGQVWVRADDLRDDQQEIMRVNNSLRDALLAIKAIAVGDRIPNWKDDWATTMSRSKIADIVDGVVR